MGGTQGKCASEVWLSFVAMTALASAKNQFVDKVAKKKKSELQNIIQNQVCIDY